MYSTLAVPVVLRLSVLALVPFVSTESNELKAQQKLATASDLLKKNLGEPFEISPLSVSCVPTRL